MVKKMLVVFSLVFLVGCDNNEQRNLNARYTQIDEKRGLIGYVTCINRTGQVVFNGVVDGKVTRAGGDNSGYYVFWFDSKGRYHQWNGEYFYTDYPLKIVVDPILIEMEGGKQ